MTEATGAAPLTDRVTDNLVATAQRLLIIGPGGAGKSELLAGAQGLANDRGRPTRLVATTTDLKLPADTGSTLLLVDDADRFVSPVHVALLGWLNRGGFLVVAHRPQQRPSAALAALDLALAGPSSPRVLGRLGVSELAARASRRLGAAVATQTAVALLHASGGWPALVDRLVDGWAAEGSREALLLGMVPAQLPALALADAAARLATLGKGIPEAVRFCAAEMIPVAALAGIAGPWPPGVAGELAAAGLLASDGGLVPLIGAAALTWGATVGTDYDGASLRLARARLALSRQGPVAALTHLQGAEDAAAKTLAAALLAGQGLARTAYEMLRGGAASPGVGAVTAALAAQPPPPLRAPVPTDGTKTTLDTATQAALTEAAAALWSDPLGSLAGFVRTADLMEAGIGNEVDLADSAHALGASVALAAGRIETAQHLLSRALRANIGGALLMHRHRLLLGWALLRQARLTELAVVLDNLAGVDLAPRDSLQRAGLEAALARRFGQLGLMEAAWWKGAALLERSETDLTALEAVGELAAAARKFGDHDAAACALNRWSMALQHVGAATGTYGALMAWLVLQSAAVVADTAGIAQAAADLNRMQLAQTEPIALAVAARQWQLVSENQLNAAALAGAVHALAGVGRSWEASQLAGLAATRSPDPPEARELLALARRLWAPRLPSALPHGTAPETGSIPSAALLTPPPAQGDHRGDPLSEREHEVAQLYVSGLSHREIGQQLFLARKTVENHLGNIHRKLATSGRAELMAEYGRRYSRSTAT